MSERVWKSPSERKWKRCLEGPSSSFTDRWSGLVFSLQKATLSAGRRAAASRAVETESLPKKPVECKEKSELSFFALRPGPLRLADPTSCRCSYVFTCGRLFLFLKEKKKIEIGATNQRQLRHETSAKSSIADFCFSSKSRHFLSWRNTSDFLAKRPQSREVLRPGNFFTHYTKIVGRFGTNAACVNPSSEPFLLLLFS